MGQDFLDIKYGKVFTLSLQKKGQRHSETKIQNEREREREMNKRDFLKL